MLLFLSQSATKILALNRKSTLICFVVSNSDKICHRTLEINGPLTKSFGTLNKLSVSNYSRINQLQNSHLVLLELYTCYSMVFGISVYMLFDGIWNRCVHVI